MPRLIWVFTGHTLILLVFSCHGSCVPRKDSDQPAHSNCLISLACPHEPLDPCLHLEAQHRLSDCTNVWADPSLCWVHTSFCSGTDKVGIWGLFRDSYHYFSIKTCCGYSLELPRWGGSDEYPQHTCIFLWRTIENYLLSLNTHLFLHTGHVFSWFSPVLTNIILHSLIGPVG